MAVAVGCAGGTHVAARPPVGQHRDCGADVAGSRRQDVVVWLGAERRCRRGPADGVRAGSVGSRALHAGGRRVPGTRDVGRIARPGFVHASGALAEQSVGTHRGAERHSAAGHVPGVQSAVHSGQSRFVDVVWRARRTSASGVSPVADRVLAASGRDGFLVRRGVDRDRHAAAAVESAVVRGPGGMGGESQTRWGTVAVASVCRLSQHAGDGDRAVRDLSGLRVPDALVPGISARVLLFGVCRTRAPPG